MNKKQFPPKNMSLAEMMLGNKVAMHHALKHPKTPDTITPTEILYAMIKAERITKEVMDLLEKEDHTLIPEKLEDIEKTIGKITKTLRGH